MYFSIFNDEVGMDSTDSISHFRDGGMGWIDLGGRIVRKEFSNLNGSKIVQAAELLQENILKVPNTFFKRMKLIDTVCSQL
ncbi:MAG: hypothetical protein GW949_04125 [Spirochaetales bacterium]|nr:hypothetical protein [Spirochaetales bacterium]